jgi:hypothetical protein
MHIDTSPVRIECYRLSPDRQMGYTVDRACSLSVPAATVCQRPPDVSARSTHSSLLRSSGVPAHGSPHLDHNASAVIRQTAGFAIGTGVDERHPRTAGTGYLTFFSHI